MMQNSLAEKYTYSLQSISDYKCKIIESDFDGMLLKVDNYKIWVKLVGKFNAYNLLAVYSVSKLLEGDTDEILQALSMVSSAEGRFQTLKSDNNIVFIIDYAHTEDALQNVLSTINSIRKKNQNLITVFGCGGDRDRLKRPLMTNVACKLSSQVIITSDNPRNENISDIISVSSSIKFCSVAKGDADVYPRFAPTMEWDTAAGHAILLGAGGSVTLDDGVTPLLYGKKDYRNGNFIAWGGMK